MKGSNKRDAQHKLVADKSEYEYEYEYGYELEDEDEDENETEDENEDENHRKDEPRKQGCCKRMSLPLRMIFVLLVYIVAFKPGLTNLLRSRFGNSAGDIERQIEKGDSVGFIEVDKPDIGSWPIMGKEHHVRLPGGLSKLNPSLLFFVKVCKAGSRSLREDTRIITPSVTGYGLFEPWYSEVGYYQALSMKSEALPANLRHKVQLYAIFREPRHHVYSQFMYCKLRKPEVELEKWLDDYYTMRPDQDMPYSRSCHDPRNLQTRYMVSKCKSTHQCKYTSKPERGKLSLSKAIANLHNLSFVAVLERYKESLCDFSVMVGGGVTETSKSYCNIRNAPKVHHSAHGVKPHSLDDVPPRLLKKMDRLTQLDQVLYNESLAVFEKQHERLKQFGFIPDTS